MRLVIGLTGGIGSGKTTALEAFERLGADTFSADEIAHELSRRGGSLYARIVRTFGRRFVGPSGELDRSALAREIFQKPAARRRLERATHPVILSEMRRRIGRSRHPVVVADVPLLFEAGLQRQFDATAVVSTSRPHALKRLGARGMRRSEALRRMRAQLPLAKKEELADVVIRNDGSRKDFLGKVRAYYNAFELIAKSSNSRKH